MTHSADHAGGVQQPRDPIGRFASTDTSANPKAKAIKAMAKEKAVATRSKVKQAKDREQRVAAAMQGQVEERLARFSEQDRKYALLSGFAKTLAQIEKESGRKTADAALQRHVEKLARRSAEESVDREDAFAERKALLKGGTKRQKAERAAIDRLHPEAKGLSTDRFKERHPEQAKDLLERHAKELALDNALTHESLIGRGEALVRETAKAIKATKSKEKQIAAMESLRQQLNESGLHRSDADYKAYMIDMADLQPYHAEQALSIMADCFQMAGGQGSTSLGQLIQDKPRAYASREDRTINIGNYVDPQVMWHEIGHHMEFEEPRLQKAAQDWRDSRATGETKSLRELEQSDSFREDEVAKPDRFVSPYVGKVYTSGSTEVVSMGVQHFWSARSMLQFYQQDPEHFHLTVGVLKRDV